MKYFDATSASHFGEHIARRNEANVIMHISRFGHLRAETIGLLVWPLSPRRSATEMARRTAGRLAEGGILIARRNAFESTSYILSARGAAQASALTGESCSDGLDLTSHAGATFRHRELTTHFLAHRATLGDEVFGEHALNRGKGPGGFKALERLGKRPDGMILVRGGGQVPLVDLVECESTYKPRRELQRVLEIAWKLNLPLLPGSPEILDQLVVVYAAHESHEPRILRAALDVARARSLEGTSVGDLIEAHAGVFEGVTLARLKVFPRLRISGVETVSMLDAMRSEFAGEILAEKHSPRP